VTGEVLEAIPMPTFLPETLSELRLLVRKYEALNDPSIHASDDPEALLKQIDAIVLDGYGLPPRIERLVADYCSDGSRSVAHTFSRYFPEEFEIWVSLSQFLSPRFQNATVGRMLDRFGTR